MDSASVPVIGHECGECREMKRCANVPVTGTVGQV